MVDIINGGGARQVSCPSRLPTVRCYPKSLKFFSPSSNPIYILFYIEAQYKRHASSLTCWIISDVYTNDWYNQWWVCQASVISIEATNSQMLPTNHLGSPYSAPIQYTYFSTLKPNTSVMQVH